jgi:cytochrome c oxidase cbb3-type subunit 3
MAERERDPVTGRLTTGHSWDGIRELNTPIPGWWVSMALICTAIAMIYMLLYPSIPSLRDYTPGWLGWSSAQALRDDQRAARAAQAGWRQRMASLTPAKIAADPELRRIALLGGRAAFGQNCAACHGPEAGGQVGQFPALVDDDWIWGGSLDDIATTIRHGIRSADGETRQGMMPSFAETLSAQQVTDVAAFVRSLSEPDAAATRNAMPGAAVFAENCASCHGAGGEAGRGVGAPRLNDRIWLYGGSAAAIRAQILHPRMGVMPAWQGRLDPETINMLAVYVHSLGGGEP